MATVTKKFLPQERSNTGAYGNAWNQVYSLDTNSSGVFTNSNLATALQIGDVVRFGIIPGGVQLIDAVALVSTTFSASTTCKIGFQYVDGVDSTSVPQDDDYFIAASTSLATAVRQQSNNTSVRPVKLPKDAYIILTLAGAANAKASALDVIVRGIQLGQD